MPHGQCISPDRVMTYSGAPAPSHPRGQLSSLAASARWGGRARSQTLPYPRSQTLRAIYASSDPAHGDRTMALAPGSQEPNSPRPRTPGSGRWMLPPGALAPEPVAGPLLTCTGCAMPASSCPEKALEGRVCYYPHPTDEEKGSENYGDLPEATQPARRRSGG